MKRHVETFAHTADVGLRATADTRAELYQALAEGLADYLCPRGEVLHSQSRQVQVEAEDDEALAVDFLSAVMNLIQADHFMVAGVTIKRLEGGLLIASAQGEPYDPTRHELHTEIKAVTYHQLHVTQVDSTWYAQVILDL